MTKFGRGGRIGNDKDGLTPRQLIQDELRIDEELIWADKPVSFVHNAKIAIPFALIGLLFLSISVNWVWQASTPLRQRVDTGDFTMLDYLFPAFGLPFVLIGVALVLSPLWQIKIATKTIYALTNKRLLILKTFPKKSLKSWSIDHVKHITRTGPSEGPGSLFFGEETVESSDGTFQNKIGFQGISQPKIVEDKLSSLMKN